MTDRPPSLWKTIADKLIDEIAEGQFNAGDKLPTEADLAARFGVNRHTVRRAFAHLATMGLVHSRRGSGVFVTVKPTQYAIGKRVRFHQNLQAEGRIPGKQVLSLTTRRADDQEAQALKIAPGAKVHVYDGLSLADNVPIAVFRSVFPAARFAGLCKDLEELGSVTSALARHAISDYLRASTRLSAVPADPVQALHLRVSEGSPLLCSHGINVDMSGVPIEFGQTWFAGERVTLTLDH